MFLTAKHLGKSSLHGITASTDPASHRIRVSLRGNGLPPALLRLTWLSPEASSSQQEGITNRACAQLTSRNPPQVFTISPGKILRALQAPCTSPQAPAQPWTEQSHTWTHGMQDLEKRAFNSPLPHIKITQGRPEHLASCPFTSIHPFTHSCCCCYLPQKAAVGLRSHSLSFPSPMVS